MPDQLVGWRVKKRSRRITALRFQVAWEIHQAFIGRDVRVLVTEPGKAGTTLGRTQEYRQVVMTESIPIGEFADIRIERARATDLFGHTVAMQAPRAELPAAGVV
jgi:tRNA A37 methylthiotransferase MiaB